MDLHIAIMTLTICWSNVRSYLKHACIEESIFMLSRNIVHAYSKSWYVYVCMYQCCVYDCVEGDILGADTCVQWYAGDPTLLILPYMSTALLLLNAELAFGDRLPLVKRVGPRKQNVLCSCISSLFYVQISFLL